ncbi:GNAT family N-acetyltransferase [Micromonospora deserti]|uniref:GNAT family N-acetyltransferase n=1 Tax=Micromonospora deserti TaxID=2070366 RepID=A0A2W2DF37_9ACTN|nr:GNAT family N-acetyltransferase [Micromonospora deserti]PZG02519.1 GNAT family N-acetyltransferase [Micromonospora deserti]
MITVTDNHTMRRFEAHDDDTIAGFAEYIRTDNLVVFTHTEVDSAYEGRGVGSQLARAGLDAARADGLRVLAICPFIAGWLARHPEYAGLEYRAASKVTD